MREASLKIANAAFYKFIRLDERPSLKKRLSAEMSRLGLKGTILLAPEGINAMIAGPARAVLGFIDDLKKDPRFADIFVKWSFSEAIPFKRALVKVKKEILTLGMEIDVSSSTTAPAISAEDLRHLLQSGQDVVLIDVRNQFEVGFGRFRGALDPATTRFSQFPRFVREKLNVARDAKIVTYCTGGIRCEKASIILKNAGYTDVAQLKGGILEYFSKTDGAFFDGSCFVFDDREFLGKDLKPMAKDR